MNDYRFEGPDPTQMIDDLIREHGAATSEESVRQSLLTVMQPEEVSQLEIIACAGDSSTAFNVELHGPPRLVQKAFARLRRRSEST